MTFDNVPSCLLLLAAVFAGIWLFGACILAPFIRWWVMPYNGKRKP